MYPVAKEHKVYYLLTYKNKLQRSNFIFLRWMITIKSKNALHFQINSKLIKLFVFLVKIG